MIKVIDGKNKETARDILKVQLPAYQVEAELIGYNGIPALRDTVETLQASGETFFGYYEENLLCGILACKTLKDVIDVHRLIVYPKHFRKGIAGQLLRFVEGYYPEAKRLQVATAAKNKPAIQFYQKHGFQQVSESIVDAALTLVYLEKVL